jgi:hypothetical protein
MSQERDDVQSHSCKSRQGCATKRPGRWVLPRSIARENASGAAPAGTLRALHYLLGIGLPPGLPPGTRSGFTVPVAPPLAPYGLAAPGTATGAWPVVVRGSVVWGWPVIGCSFLVSGSRARKFWALALAPSNDVATTRVTVHFNAFLVFVQVHSERAKKCRRSAQFRFAPRCARCSACGDEARAGGSPRCRWGPALLFNTSPAPLRSLCQRRPEISSRAARMRDRRSRRPVSRA